MTPWSNQKTAMRSIEQDFKCYYVQQLIMPTVRGQCLSMQLSSPS